MIIYFCTSTFKNIENGPSKFAHLLLELNDRPGVELYIYSEDTGDYESQFIHKIQLKSNWVSNKIGMLTRIEEYYDFFQKEITVKRPDVIVFNNAITGIKCFKNLDVPCIGMINDDSSLNASIFSYGFTKKYVRHRVFKYLEQKATQSADSIIINSKFLLRQVEQSYKIPKSGFKLLYKSIDTEVKHSKNEYSMCDPVSILFVKSDWHRGGLHILIQALSLIKYKFSINAVGPKLQDFEQIRKFNTTQNVSIKFCGTLSQEDVFKQLSTTNIFCTPSLNEALGVANMEALIHKVPVVYTDVGGIPEVMNFGKNGFKASSNDPKSLAKAIRDCIEKNEERKLKTENGYSFVKSNFNKDNMLTNFLKICCGVIDS